MRYLLAQMIADAETSLTPLFSSTTVMVMLYLRAAILSIAAILFINYVVANILKKKRMKKSLRQATIISAIFLGVIMTIFTAFEIQSQLWNLCLLFFYALFLGEKKKLAPWMVIGLSFSFFAGWFVNMPLF